MTTSIGGGLGSTYTIIDPTTSATGQTGATLIGGTPPGSSDYSPRTTPSYQSATLPITPYAAGATAATTMIPTMQPINSGMAQSFTGQTSIAAPADPAQDRILYAHVAAPSSAAPAGETAAPAAENPREIEVKDGDSLSKLAAVNGTTWQQLYELNKDLIGGNPDLIKPGQKLKLP